MDRTVVLLDSQTARREKWKEVLALRGFTVLEQTGTPFFELARWHGEEVALFCHLKDFEDRDQYRRFFGAVSHLRPIVFSGAPLTVTKERIVANPREHWELILGQIVIARYLDSSDAQVIADALEHFWPASSPDAFQRAIEGRAMGATLSLYLGAVLLDKTMTPDLTGDTRSRIAALDWAACLAAARDETHGSASDPPTAMTLDALHEVRAWARSALRRSA